MEDEGTGNARPVGQSFIIKRPRLTKLLDDSEARLILLVAPAGYGKTTLAREWLKPRRGPCAWFSVTPASADVAALSIGIAVELELAVGDGSKIAAERLAALAAVQQHPDALARVLVTSRRDWPAGLVLAIDDYHHLADRPMVEDFVGALVQLLPATFVITSRTRPSWVAPRFEIYGAAFELGRQELSMTDEEAVQVLRRSTGAHRTSSVERAHGWPAIIGLAAHTQAEDLPDVIPRRLYDFLAADLVGSAPTTVQEALAVLAIAGVGDLPTALALLGAGAAPTIRDAEKRGLLTFADNDRLTLHPLLSDFLVASLRRETEKLSVLVDELVPALVASRRWNECLALATAVPEQGFPLERVLESALEDLLDEGRLATVSRWTQLARDAGIDAPIVDLAEGEVALRAGDYERALALGSRSARGIASPELRTRALLLAARSAHLADHSAVARNWFQQAEKAASSNTARATAIWGQFVVRFDDESGSLGEALTRFAAATDGTIEHELRSAQGQVLLAQSDGAMPAALDASFAGVALLSLPAEALTRLATLNHHAWILGLSGRYLEALVASERGLAEAEAACIDFAATFLQVARVTALIGLRRFSSAQQVLAELTSRGNEEPHQWALANLPLAQAKLQIGLGDLEQARDCFALALDSRQCASQRSEFDGYRGLISAASGLVSEGEEWARLSAQASTHIEGTAFPAVIRAIVAVRTGASLAVVSEQFELALATGLRDPIVTACRACPELVEQMSQTTARDTLVAMLSESRDTALARRSGLQLPRSTRHVEGLSPRELEVYELIVQGRTNREISQVLFISESTTKVHVRHILEKLGVRSRVEAVRAWSLDR
jgi:LuxR family transcriptional regulator, maltose regulon positive regulatory protein